MNFKIKNTLIILLITYSSQLFSQKKALVITHKRNKDNSIDFYYKKTNPGSTYIVITFKNLTNCKKSKIKKTIKSWDGFLFKLRPINTNKRIQFYSYRFQSVIGNPNAKIDTNFVYILPFKKGKKVFLKELRHSKVFDSIIANSNYKVIKKKLEQIKSITWKNIFFSTKLNDTVCAVRKGIVTKVFNRFIKKKQELGINQTSFITIEHKDGSFAVYSSLKRNSIMVKLGDIVYPSTPLGLTGSDGKSENSKLSLSFYYLNKDSIFNKHKRHVSFRPFFYTKNGENKLELNTEYIADYTEEMITKEMKRREKKKWKKRHKK